MDIQDHTKTTTAPPGHEVHGVHICHRCGWPFPNPHPSSKHRRAHKRICGTIEGYTKVIDSQAVSDDEHEHHSDSGSGSGSGSGSDDAVKDKEKTPSPKMEKRIIKESGSSAGGTEKRSNRSEDDLFSDEVTEMNEISEIKDQREDVYVLSVLSDIPLIDHAENLIEDFKDYKTISSKDSINGSMVDTFEVKTAEDSIHETQTSEESLMESKTDPESTDNLSKVEVIKKDEVDHGVPVLTEVYTQETVKEPQNGIEANQKMVESVVAYSKDSGKSGISERLQEFIPEKTDNSQNATGIVSETLLDGGDGKLMTSQDYGVDASIGSSSHNSLEGNWGSVSVLSTASENAQSINKSEISEYKSRVGKSDAFEGSLLEPKEEIIDQKASEFKAVTLQNSQPPKSEANVGNETEGRKRNEEAISKVTNWSASASAQTTTPLTKLVKEAKLSNPIKLPTAIQKDEPVRKTNEPEKPNLKQETAKVNQESSPPKYIGEDKKAKKKSKGRTSWVPFACCSSANVK